MTLGVRRASLVSTQPVASPCSWEQIRSGPWQRRLPGARPGRPPRRRSAWCGVSHVPLLPTRDCGEAEQTATRDRASTRRPPSRGHVASSSREGRPSPGLSGPGTPCRLCDVPTFRCTPAGAVPPPSARCSVLAADGRDGVGDHRAHGRVPAAAQAPGALHSLHRPGHLPALPLLRHQRTYGLRSADGAPSALSARQHAGAVRPGRGQRPRELSPRTTLVIIRRKLWSCEG